MPALMPPLLALLRPHQWIKNSFVLVGLLFGHAWHDPALLQQGLWAFLTFCLLSSSVYIFNDLRDREQDRLHPKKRRRPLAAGTVSVTAALLLFTERMLFPAWMVFVILAREFIITSLRNVAAAKGRVLAATWTGKVKTVVQIAAIVLIFLFAIVTSTGTPLPTILVTLCAWAATLVTLYAGWDYLAKNWDIVKDGAVK